MGKWAAFVLGMAMVPAAWGAWWVFVNVKMPTWAWFGAGITTAVVMKTVQEIVGELRLALAETSEEALRPWFKPIWRALSRAGWTVNSGTGETPTR